MTHDFSTFFNLVITLYFVFICVTTSCGWVT